MITNPRRRIFILQRRRTLESTRITRSRVLAPGSKCAVFIAAVPPPLLFLRTTPFPGAHTSRSGAPPYIGVLSAMGLCFSGRPPHQTRNHIYKLAASFITWRDNRFDTSVSATSRRNTAATI